MMMEEDLQQYPEKIYFRNSIVVGNLPQNLDLKKLFDYFDDISFWKLNGKRVIPDLRNSSLKAVILIYDDEESARICSLRLKSVTSISFTLYDGIYLFYYCEQLGLTCDARSKNILVSGIDSNKSQDTYFDIVGKFGTVNYFEFCAKGDIPKFRVEFSRATSAFAALLSLQTALGQSAVITMEMPLFPICPIGHTACRSAVAQGKKTMYNALRMQEEMKEQAVMLRTMNIYQQKSAHFNGVPEKYLCQKNTSEEYTMETLSFGVSRQLLREKFSGPRVIPKRVLEYFERNDHDIIQNFLKSNGKIVENFNYACNEMPPLLMRQNMM